MNKKHFPSGLTLVVKTMPLLSVTMGIYVGVGSGFESVAQNGYSHFIEHMMFKGTQKRSAYRITEEIGDIGGQINAFTSKDNTCYYATTIKEHAAKGFEILTDMFFGSKFDENDIEKEKGVVIEEIKMKFDKPDELCQDLSMKAYFGSHPLGRTVGGEAENIRSLTREGLMEFKEKYYFSSNIVISMAGGITLAEAEGICAEFESRLSRCSKTRPILSAAPRQKSNLAAGFKDIGQAHLAVLSKGVPYEDKNVMNALVFSSIFGGGFGSRLFRRIREERSLAYTVFSYLVTYENNGFLDIYAGVGPKNVAEYLSLLNKEIKEITKNGITEDELNRGKEQVKGGLVFSMENASNVMRAYAKYMGATGKVYDINEKIGMINKVTRGDVVDIGRYMLDFDGMCAGYVGKEENCINILEALKQ